MKIFGNWAVMVPAFYISFVLVLVGFVVWTTTQKVELVDNNYYDKDLVYQQHIDKVERTKQLPEQIFIANAQNNVIVKFPSIFQNEKITGEIFFFRPSSSAMDKKIPVSPDSTGIQLIQTDKLAKGHWRVKIEWQAKNVSYYNEQTLEVN